MEGFQAEDRHHPLPHIALSTTALKSAYKNTPSLSTHSSIELQELQDSSGLEWQPVHAGSRKGGRNPLPRGLYSPPARPTNPLLWTRTSPRT
jgi:hypothetical protein